jgi:hypothetical protein
VDAATAGDGEEREEAGPSEGASATKRARDDDDDDDDDVGEEEGGGDGNEVPPAVVMPPPLDAETGVGAEVEADTDEVIQAKPKPKKRKKKKKKKKRETTTTPAFMAKRHAKAEAEAKRQAAVFMPLARSGSKRLEYLAGLLTNKATTRAAAQRAAAADLAHVMNRAVLFAVSRRRPKGQTSVSITPSDLQRAVDHVRDEQVAARRTVTMPMGALSVVS